MKERDYHSCCCGLLWPEQGHRADTNCSTFLQHIEFRRLERNRCWKSEVGLIWLAYRGPSSRMASGRGTLTPLIALSLFWKITFIGLLIVGNAYYINRTLIVHHPPILSLLVTFPLWLAQPSSSLNCQASHPHKAERENSSDCCSQNPP